MGRPVRGLGGWLSNQVAKKVWINGCQTDFDGIPVVFRPNVGVMTSTVIYWKGIYEAEVWRALKHLLPGASHFVDVGSNIGLYSVLAKKLSPSLRIDAFEPVPVLHAMNVEMHRANGLDPSCVRR